MNNKINHYNRYPDLLRAVFCISVLLYHLGLSEGGYLAVCGFFVLSGYLTCSSFVNKEQLNLKKYYIGRIRRIWIPLFLTVFITVTAVSFFDSVVWITMKQEVLSVLLGYNNFWQMAANQDYFAAHADSPFMHFWYIAILMQFTLFFPLIFSVTSRKSRECTAYTIYFLTFASLIALLYFGKTVPLSNFYYNTFSRVFSLMAGAMFAMHRHLQIQYGIQKKETEKGAKVETMIDMGGLIALFILIPADSSTMPSAVILTTLMTCYVLQSSWYTKDCSVPLSSGIAKFISDYSYEIYLVQYPVIYLFHFQEKLSAASTALVAAETSVIILFAILLHTAVNAPDHPSVSGKALLAALTAVSIYGVFCCVTAKDYTEDMKQLEAELSASAEFMKEQQTVMPAVSEEAEETSYSPSAGILEKIETVTEKENSLKDQIPSTSFTAIGDSVLLSASGKMYETFPNMYCDAAVSRTAWAATGILNDLISRNMLSDYVVFNLGANGSPPDSVVDSVIDLCGRREIFLVTVTNNSSVHVNEGYQEYAKNRNNVHIIDWASAASGHPEYFVSDGLHLTSEGQTAYTNTVFNAFYDLQMKKLRTEESRWRSVYSAQERFKLVP